MVKEKRFYGIAFSYVFGVFNDNAFKFAVIFIITRYFGAQFVGTDKEKELYELALNSEVSVYFFLPFVIFATVAGWACDRFSRHSILKYSKLSEIAVMSIGAWGIYMFENSADIGIYHSILG